MSKATRGEQGEKLVALELEKIKEYHLVLNDVTFLNKKSEMTHQIDHILIHSHGIFVIETKNYFGEIKVDPDKPFLEKIVNGKIERINNPLHQNKSHAITIYKTLKGEHEVIPVVVFVKNNAPYLGDENVINLEDLLLFIDSYPYKHKITKPTMDKVYSVLKRRSSDVSKEEHLENIGYLKQIKKEIKDEIRYAVENRKCPRCGKKICNKGNLFCCQDCDFHFHF